jgi:predicted transcriptional regulator
VKAVPLSDLRKHLGLTQAEVAAGADMPQAHVARLETRHAGGDDVKLSTLARYVRGLGGTLEIDVVLGGKRFRLEST